MLLERLKDQGQLKKFNIKQLKVLSQEIREEVLKVITANGGHLSPNLGVIEATIAIHYVFDLPTDKLIFDVGHQCYAHKILSGRLGEFSSIRTASGLSGFQCKEESEFDPFSTGHAGNSIALSIGLAQARDRVNENYSVINVVGDGSFVNGLNLEALTVAKVKPKNLIVILNDNEMSISKNQNGFYELISRHTSGKSYLRSKRAVKKVFGDSFVSKGLKGVRNFFKRIFGKRSIIEDSGFKYVGIIDGNDLQSMIKYLKRVKELAKDKAVFLHIKTRKGKGYGQAEEHADRFHGVGKDLKSSTGVFSKTLGESLVSAIEKNKNIVAITAGMKDGTGLIEVENTYPENFYDVGIAEEYAVSVAAGLARGGVKPVVAIYSTFMQRAYDQILHDVCLQNLPIVFCLDRAGLVGADGKTHQGVFDLSYLGHIPNLKIFAPSSVEEFKIIFDYAISLNSPVAIRYPNDNGATFDAQGVADSWQMVKKSQNEKAVILAVGPRMVRLAIEISNENSSVSVVSARMVKPLDIKFLNGIQCEKIITLEENSFIGGFGQQVLSYYADLGVKKCVKTFAVKDEFIAHAGVLEQLENCSLSKSAVLEELSKGEN